MFVRAGRMGSIRQELKGKVEGGRAKIQITGFREQDQENLYEQVREAGGRGGGPGEGHVGTRVYPGTEAASYLGRDWGMGGGALGISSADG